MEMNQCTDSGGGLSLVYSDSQKYTVAQLLATSAYVSSFLCWKRRVDAGYVRPAPDPLASLMLKCSVCGVFFLCVSVSFLIADIQSFNLYSSSCELMACGYDFCTVMSSGSLTFKEPISVEATLPVSKATLLGGPLALPLQASECRGERALSSHVWALENALCAWISLAQRGLKVTGYGPRAIANLPSCAAK